MVRTWYLLVSVFVTLIGFQLQIVHCLENFITEGNNDQNQMSRSTSFVTNKESVKSFLSFPQLNSLKLHKNKEHNKVDELLSNLGNAFKKISIELMKRSGLKDKRSSSHDNIGQPRVLNFLFMIPLAIFEFFAVGILCFTVMSPALIGMLLMIKTMFVSNLFLLG